MSKFDPNKMKPIKLKKGVKLFRDDSVDYIGNNQAMLKQFMVEAIMEGDREAFYELFSALLAVINKEELSRKSKVPIATIRRMAAGANFNIENMLKINAVIHKELAA